MSTLSPNNRTPAAGKPLPQDHPAGAVFTNVNPAQGASKPGKIDPHAVTISGLILNPVYGPEHGPAGQIAESLRSPQAIDEHLGKGGMPGQYPFTRGLFPQGYRTRLWTMRQFAGFGSADDTNRRFKYLLEQARSSTAANTGLSTAFDLPTLMGRDSDDPLSAGEVGKCGVAISSIEDMHRLYADIPVGQVTVSQTINGPAAVIWAMYLAHALQRGIGWETLGGTLQNDILKEFHAQNEFIYPPEASVKLVVDTIEFQSRLLPKWNSVSISGYHIREAGSTAAQELAFTLRDGMEYVEACLERGMNIDEFAPRLSFFFNAHNHLFEEVAKFRAARRMWARMMREEFGAKDERSWMLRFHTQTAGSMLTSQQPENNVVRVTMQALAAVLGGTQSLHTNGMDEALSLPTEKTARLALRTQQILGYETGVADVVDPLGGSPFVESLTDELEERAREILLELDRRGGPVAAIESGWVQREIQKSAMTWLRAVESGEEVVVGVNRYQIEEGAPELFVPSEEARRQVLVDLAEVRKRRDPARVEAACQALERDAKGTANLMHPILAAVEVDATIGEICAVLERVFGKYRPPEVL